MTRRPKQIVEPKPEPTTPPETIEALQFKIKAAWGKAVTSIIATGKLVKKIHDDMPWGERHRLYEGPNKPFSDRTAMMLIALPTMKSCQIRSMLRIYRLPGTACFY
jgi:hypothetical protein